MVTQGSIPNELQDVASEATSETCSVSSVKSASSGLSSKKGISKWSAAANIVTANIGTGILLLPKAFTVSGYAFGSIFSILSGILAMQMCILFARTLQIAEDMHHREMRSMEDVAKVACNNTIALIVRYLFNISIFVVLVTFIVLMGDLLADLYTFHRCDNYTSKVLWKCLFAVFLVLVSWISDVSRIAKFGAVGVLCCVIVMVMIFVGSFREMFMHLTTLPGHPVVPPIYHIMGAQLPQLLSALVKYIYSYGAVLIIPTLARDMEKPKEIKQAIIIGHIIVISIYTSVSVVAYIAFGDGVDLRGQSILYDNILSTFSHYAGKFDVEYISSTIATVINCSVTYPILMNVLVRNIEDNVEILKEPRYRYVFRSTTVLLSLGCACTPVAFFADLIGLIPGVTLTIISMIMPPVIYWSLEHRLAGFKLALSKKYFVFTGHTLVFLLSLVAMSMSVFTSFSSILCKIRHSANLDMC